MTAAPATERTDASAPPDAAAARVALEPVATLRATRALAWRDAELFASRHHAVGSLRVADDGSVGAWQHVMSYRPEARHVAAAFVRPAARALRSGLHGFAWRPDGGVVAIVPKGVATAAPGETRLRRTAHVERGSRPLAVCVTPSGAIYWGEYFFNKTHDAVRVFGSFDGGASWRTVHTFPPGTVEHVHNIVHDRFRNCLWIATGDLDHESMLLRADLDFKNIEVVVQGDQQARAVALVPTARGLFFASDTPLAANHVYRLDDDDKTHRLSPLPASCLSGTSVGEAVFFSTAVEPSDVNPEQHACIYGSADGTAFERLVAWRKDAWPQAAFQFGNIHLTGTDAGGGLLAATGQAVRGFDGATQVWRVARRAEQAGTSDGAKSSEQ